MLGWVDPWWLQGEPRPAPAGLGNAFAGRPGRPGRCRPEIRGRSGVSAPENGVGSRFHLEGCSTASSSSRPDVVPRFAPQVP